MKLTVEDITLLIDSMGIAYGVNSKAIGGLTLTRKPNPVVGELRDKSMHICKLIDTLNEHKRFIALQG